MEPAVGDSIKNNVDTSVEPHCNFIGVGGSHKKSYRLCFGHICEEDNEGAYPIAA